MRAGSDEFADRSGWPIPETPPDPVGREREASAHDACGDSLPRWPGNTNTETVSQEPRLVRIRCVPVCHHCRSHASPSICIYARAMGLDHSIFPSRPISRSKGRKLSEDTSMRFAAESVKSAMGSGLEFDGPNGQHVRTNFPTVCPLSRSWCARATSARGYVVTGGPWRWPAAMPSTRASMPSRRRSFSSNI